MTKDIISDESQLFQDWLLDDYSTLQNSDTFEYLNFSAFSSFFNSANVDTPRCLLSSWASRRNINRQLLLKLSNYVMRQGNRQQSLNLLVSSLNRPYESHLTSNVLPNSYLGWKSIFTVISLSHYNKYYSQFPHNLTFINKYNYTYNFLGKEHNNYLDKRNVVLTNINSISPMFSFYVYKVDKAIYKNSRGRSGKYTFLWKYLPPYKRRQLVLAWIAKEIKMQQGRSLKDRVQSIIYNICHKPDTLFVNKVQSFSTNYVYRNARKSLCETYRTSTK